MKSSLQGQIAPIWGLHFCQLSSQDLLPIEHCPQVIVLVFLPNLISCTLWKLFPICGRQNNGSPGCPCSNPWKLLKGPLYTVQDFTGVIKGLKGPWDEIIPDYLRESHIDNSKGPCKWKRKGQAVRVTGDVGWTQTQEKPTCGLEMERGTTSQRMQVPPAAAKGKDTDSPLDSAGGTQPCWHLHFSPVRPFLTSRNIRWSLLWF